MTLIFIVYLTVIRVQSVELPSHKLLLHVEDGRTNFDEHCSVTVSLIDNVSVSSAICQLHATIPNSTYSPNPNRTCVLHNLNRSNPANHVKFSLLILAGDVSLNPGPNHVKTSATRATIKNNSDGFKIPRPSEAQEEQFECFKRKGLHCIHLNVHSLLPKISELRIIANKTSAAVITLTETWIGNLVTNSEISIDGYTVFRKDRNRHGGGVCLYIKNNIAFNQRDDLNNDNIETLFVDILLPRSKPIVVGVCYRPDPEDLEFLIQFEETVSKIKSDCEIMILGDFNINSLLPVNSCRY